MIYFLFLVLLISSICFVSFDPLNLFNYSVDKLPVGIDRLIFSTHSSKQDLLDLVNKNNLSKTTAVDLNDIFSTKESIDNLFTLLKIFPNLEKLKLKFGKIDVAVARSISNGLKKCHTLNEVYITTTKIGPYATSLIVKALWSCPELEKLSLMFGNVNIKKFHIIEEGLKKYSPNLELLEFSFNSPKFEGGACILRINKIINKIINNLQQNIPKLLYVCGTSPTYAGSYEIIGKSLSYWPKLKVLNLGMRDYNKGKLSWWTTYFQQKFYWVCKIVNLIFY